jgi:glycine hydroxymethyltransferase
VHYGVGLDNGRINYEILEELALKERPKMITVGASAYSRTIDFETMGRIAKKAGCLLLADIAHIAGLVATGLHPSPVPHADFVTTTTHKTLRGPRGGLILCKAEYAKAIDAAVFPGSQGGPLMHIIAAKAVCFKEAMSESFKSYQAQILANTRTLCETLAQQGFGIVSGGTDNHLFLIDLRKSHSQMTGKEAQDLLERAQITTNRNTVPGETRSPFQTSGLRIGSPAVTSRGMKEPEMVRIANAIAMILNHPDSIQHLQQASGTVAELCKQFPLPYSGGTF